MNPSLAKYLKRHLKFKAKMVRICTKTNVIYSIWFFEGIRKFCRCWQKGSAWLCARFRGPRSTCRGTVRAWQLVSPKARGNVWTRLESAYFWTRRTLKLFSVFHSDIFNNNLGVIYFQEPSGRFLYISKYIHSYETYFEYPLLAKHSPQHLMSSEQCGTVPRELGGVCSLCSVLMDVVMKPSPWKWQGTRVQLTALACLWLTISTTQNAEFQRKQHSENSYWCSYWSASFPILLCQNCHFFSYCLLTTLTYHSSLHLELTLCSWCLSVLF